MSTDIEPPENLSSNEGKLPPGVELFNPVIHAHHITNAARRILEEQPLSGIPRAEGETATELLSETAGSENPVAE